MLIDELAEIIKKEKDVIPFLKKLTPADKKELVPHLKKLKAEYYATKEVKERSGGFSYMTSVFIKSEKQRKLVEKACFVCCGKADMKRLFWGVGNLAASDEYINEIIPWYVPKWYGQIINEEMPWELSYEKLMRLYKEGLLEPSQELILGRLPNAIVEHEWKKQKRASYYNPNILYQHPETLNDHIWLLFEEESGINSYYNYLHLENYKGGNDIWIDTLKALIQEGRLNRKKVLVATLFTATKGFNKTLSGWFFDLLIALNPTKDEILSLQSELFAALHSPHSKVLNTVLKFLKPVVEDDKFKFKVFIENASILLNSETKSVVHATLMVLDKIGKTRRTSKPLVCISAAEALINLDEKIQLRAAKIIAKYGDTNNASLVEEIGLYSDALFHSAKAALQAYELESGMTDDDTEEQVVPVRFLTEENRLPHYSSLDERIFFVSQVIDNNDVFHIDQLLSTLPKLYTQLNANNVSKLEPIFKRAFDLSMNSEWSGQIGNLESEAAFFINDFAEILISKFPLELKSFKKAKAKKIQAYKQNRFYGSHYKDKLLKIEERPIVDYIYQIHRELFIKSKSYIERGLELELLSTPTHGPCWIDPVVLINRILAYERVDERSDLYDFQIALGRLLPSEIPSHLAAEIDRIEDSTMKDILNYHFGFIPLASVLPHEPFLLVQSILARNIASEIVQFQEHLQNPLTKERGVYPWHCKPSDFYYSDFDYTKRKYVEKKMIKKHLKIEGFQTPEKEEGKLVSSLKGLLGWSKKRVGVKSFYDYMKFKKQHYYTGIWPHDEVRFLFLSPNNPSAFLSHVVHHNLKESTFSDETGKKNMINLLKGLYRIWHRADYTKTTYLFVATGLLCSDKVSRELGAELWIKTNSEGTMDNKRLGAILGKLEAGEYAPLKRFTDLLAANMFNVSKTHNRNLFTLLNTTIGHMGDAPIRGLKKLLEIFLELSFSFPKMKLEPLTIEKLGTWQATKSLKTMTAKLLS